MDIFCQRCNARLPIKKGSPKNHPILEPICPACGYHNGQTSWFGPALVLIITLGLLLLIAMLSTPR